MYDDDMPGPATVEATTRMNYIMTSPDRRTIVYPTDELYVLKAPEAPKAAIPTPVILGGRGTVGVDSPSRARPMTPSVLNV